MGQRRSNPKNKFLRFLGRFLASGRSLAMMLPMINMKIGLMLLAMLGGATLISMAADAAPHRTGKLFHVVSFKFKASASPGQIKEVTDAFRDLKKKIKEIQSYEWGTNISPEKLNKGFTHGFVLTFKSDQARDAYLVHPDHKAFGALLQPILDDVFVIDFWAEK
jgi:hypothetical protein